MLSRPSAVDFLRGWCVCVCVCPCGIKQFIVCLRYTIEERKEVLADFKQTCNSFKCIFLVDDFLLVALSSGQTFCYNRRTRGMKRF